MKDVMNSLIKEVTVLYLNESMLLTKASELMNQSLTH